MKWKFFRAMTIFWLVAAGVALLLEHPHFAVVSILLAAVEHSTAEILREMAEREERERAERE